MVARSVRRRSPAAMALRLALAAPALVPLIPGPAVQARPQDPPMPSQGELRQLQQLVFTCGRENASGPCAQARGQADPLLDHPRLAGSCKDVLWQIREEAVTVQENSFGRRDRLDRAGQDLLRFCQRNSQPSTPKATTSPPRPAPGFGFSGGDGR